MINVVCFGLKWPGAHSRNWSALSQKCWSRCRARWRRRWRWCRCCWPRKSCSNNNNLSFAKKFKTFAKKVFFVPAAIKTEWTKHFKKFTLSWAWVGRYLLLAWVGRYLLLAWVDRYQLLAWVRRYLQLVWVSRYLLLAWVRTYWQYKSNGVGRGVV